MVDQLDGISWTRRVATAKRSLVVAIEYSRVARSRYACRSGCGVDEYELCNNRRFLGKLSPLKECTKLIVDAAGSATA